MALPFDDTGPQFQPHASRPARTWGRSRHPGRGRRWNPAAPRVRAGKGANVLPGGPRRGERYQLQVGDQRASPVPRHRPGRRPKGCYGDNGLGAALRAGAAARCPLRAGAGNSPPEAMASAQSQV